MKQPIVFNTITTPDPFLGKVVDIQMLLDTDSELGTIEIVPRKGSRFTMYEVAFLMAAKKIVEAKPEFKWLDVAYLGTTMREAFSDSCDELSKQSEHVFQAFIDRKVKVQAKSLWEKKPDVLDFKSMIADVNNAEPVEVVRKPAPRIVAPVQTTIWDEEEAEETIWKDEQGNAIEEVLVKKVTRKFGNIWVPVIWKKGRDWIIVRDGWLDTSVWFGRKKF